MSTQEQISQDRPAPWPDGRPKHIPQGTEVIEHPPRYFVLSESKALSLLLWIGMGLFCAYFGYNPNFMPIPPFRHWPTAFGLLGSYIAITLVLRETVVLYMKQRHEQDASLALSRKLLLLAWVSFLALAAGLFIVPGLILAFALVLVGLVGYLFRWLKRMAQPDRPLPTLHIKPTYAFIQPGASLLLGILLIPLAFLMAQYGIWLIILAPLLSLACLGLWVWLERGAMASSPRWWAGALVLALLPFVTTGLAYHRQVIGSDMASKSGILSAIKFAPQWSPKQKVSLLLDSSFPSDQQQARRRYLTQLWLRSDIPASKVEEALKLFSSQWAQDLAHIPKLQRPIIHKIIARLDQQRSINGGIPYTNDAAHVIGHLYQHLPKQRHIIQAALVQQLLKPIGCKTKKMPCQNARSYLRGWLDDTLSTRGGKDPIIHLLFPTSDLLWETWRKLPGADQTLQMRYLLQQLTRQATKSKGASSIFPHILVFHLLDEDTYYLRKLKPKDVSKKFEQLLIQLIQHDLRSSVREWQLMGMMLFGQACRVQSKRLNGPRCNRLLREFQRPAWEALQAQAKSPKGKRIVDAIASPTSVATNDLRKSRALLTLSLEALRLHEQLQRISLKPLPKEPQAQLQEKIRRINKRIALQKKLKELAQQKKAIEQQYRLDKPFEHQKRKKPAPTSKPTSRPTP